MSEGTLKTVLIMLQKVSISFREIIFRYETNKIKYIWPIVSPLLLSSRYGRRSRPIEFVPYINHR